MSEILSAASLLMTVATILFSIWHREILEALEFDVQDYEKTNRNNRRKVQRVLRFKAGPLALMATATVLAFVPDWLSIVFHSAKNYYFNGFHGLANYSSVHTALCLVILSIGGLAGHSVYLCIRLYRHSQLLALGKKPQLPHAKSPRDASLNQQL
jgi:hypothetical protein